MKKYLLTLVSISLFFSTGYSQKTAKPFAFNTDNKIIYDICFSAKGGVLGIADGNNIKVYNTVTRELLYEFWGGHRDQILSIDISKDSTLMVSGGKDSTIVIWDFIGKQIIKKLNYHNGSVNSVKISPDRKYLASGGTDNKVFLYDLEKNELVYEFTGHTKVVTSVEFKPDGSILASASADKSIILHDVATRTVITSIYGHSNWVRDITFNNEGTRMISCGDDRRLIVWDITRLQAIWPIEDIKGEMSWLLCADYNADNKSFIFGNVSGISRFDSNINRNFAKRLGAPISRILFVPGSEADIEIAAATLGKGVLLFGLKDMDN